MRMWLLGSGSRGNAVVLESGDTRLLVDAGFTPSVLAARLREVDVAPESIQAVIVTHEHTDHVRGARVLCERFGWAAYATAGTVTASRDLDMLILEANHDELMLHAGPYPASVRARISGRNGHLSNGRAGQLAREVTHKGLRQIVLAHISEKCNTPRTALSDVSAAMSRTRFSGRLSAAHQDRTAGPFEPGLRRPRAVQLDLAF